MIEQLMGLIHTIYDVKEIIQWGGVLIICIIIFAETGLLAGFFLPGDSLLVTAGIFASAGHLNLFLLLIFCSLSAIIGDQTGYYIGHKTGKFLFSKKDSLLFKHEHLEKAKVFYERHGPKTIVIARFVPIVRTFAPSVAGSVGMSYKRFVFYNIFGGVLWVFSTILIGFFLGSLIPDIDKKIHIVVGVVIVLSLVPIMVEVIKNKRIK
ncbi:MAG: VTT domain-containing protein [Nanoarchaeota archaeon]